MPFIRATAITAPENKIFSSEYKIDCSSCGAFVTEKLNYTHTLNVASTVVDCNVGPDKSSGVQVGKGRQCHSLPTVHNQDEEEMNFCRTKGKFNRKAFKNHAIL